MLTEIFCPLFGCLKVAIIASQQISRRKPVHKARNRVGFLAIVVFFSFAGEFEYCSIVGVIDRLVAKLSFQVKVGNRLNLFNPPVRAFKEEFVGSAPHEQDILCLQDVVAIFRIKHAVGRQIAPWGEHLA